MSLSNNPFRLSPKSAREALTSLIAEIGQETFAQLDNAYGKATPITASDTEMQSVIDGIMLTTAILMASLMRDHKALLLALADPAKYAECVSGNALALVAAHAQHQPNNSTTPAPAPSKVDVDALLADLERQMRGE